MYNVNITTTNWTMSSDIFRTSKDIKDIIYFTNQSLKHLTNLQKELERQEKSALLDKIIEKYISYSDSILLAAKKLSKYYNPEEAHTHRVALDTRNNSYMAYSAEHYFDHSLLLPEAFANLVIKELNKNV